MRKLPRRVDVWDGQPLPRIWRMDIDAKKRGLTVLAERPRRAEDYPHNLWQGYVKDVWCGEWKGYGRDSDGKPLFRNLQTALRFAVACYRAGYRVKGGKR